MNLWESFKKIGVFKEKIVKFVDQINSENFINFHNLSVLSDKKFEIDYDLINNWLSELKVNLKDGFRIS